MGDTSRAPAGAQTSFPLWEPVVPLSRKSGTRSTTGYRLSSLRLAEHLKMDLVHRNILKLAERKWCRETNARSSPLPRDLLHQLKKPALPFVLDAPIHGNALVPLAEIALRI